MNSEEKDRGVKTPPIYANNCASLQQITFTCLLHCIIYLFRSSITTTSSMLLRGDNTTTIVVDVPFLLFHFGWLVHLRFFLFGGVETIFAFLGSFTRLRPRRSRAGAKTFDGKTTTTSCPSRDTYQSRQSTIRDQNSTRVALDHQGQQEHSHQLKRWVF